MSTTRARLRLAQAFAANKDKIVSEAELVALISTVLRQKGMEDGDDPGYVTHARQLAAAASKVADEARVNDLKGARAAVEKTKHACTQCHAEYR